ncbi:hypothetical protein BD289DRAFT_448884 [Coniella lustricola]|uniref:Uncharacterized protein n=1 Tax=Coniella lustricola TaxID=2025994 RepID=A0A2T2ZRS5_9PEZI|nr:hypothetical protein BD289DRAFT_448884 [Coniella lustricola]
MVTTDVLALTLVVTGAVRLYHCTTVSLYHCTTVSWTRMSFFTRTCQLQSRSCLWSCAGALSSLVLLPVGLTDW